MKTAVIALLALACAATAWAGTPNPGPNQLPDGGSSALLLGMGVIAVIRGLRR